MGIIAQKRENGESKARLEALRRAEILGRVDRARAGGMNVRAALAVEQLPKSTYYDWRRRRGDGGLDGLAPHSRRPHSHPGRQWDLGDARRVFELRDEMFWAGKEKLHRPFVRRHARHPLSEATIGRILAWGMARGHVRRCAVQCGESPHPKRQRDFTDTHAERWTREDKHRHCQADHMTLTIGGRTFKEFRMVCPHSRRQYAEVHARASGAAARAFLERAVPALGVAGVQVDGGSEFRGAFEDACARRGLPLKVLPPRRPDLNGMVERANRTARRECWTQHAGEANCAALNKTLSNYLHYYNEERPHRSLGGETPNERARMLGMAA